MIIHPITPTTTKVAARPVQLLLAITIFGALVHGFAPPACFQLERLHTNRIDLNKNVIILSSTVSNVTATTAVSAGGTNTFVVGDDGGFLQQQDHDEYDDETTLLIRLGGEPALEAAVDVFYDRVVKDPSLNRFFDGIDMKSLRLHQYRFMKIAFSDIPTDMDVVSYISKAHFKLLRDHGLNESHFDTVAGHLVSTLQGLGVTNDLIDEVVATVGPLRCVFETPPLPTTTTTTTTSKELPKEG